MDCEALCLPESAALLGEAAELRRWTGHYILIVEACTICTYKYLYNVYKALFRS